jgi:hypothetical protein
MPTPMHVYADIAARYGKYNSNQEVDDFFANVVPTLSQPEQECIFAELLVRDGEEKPESLMDAFEHLFDDKGNMKSTPEPPKEKPDGLPPLPKLKSDDVPYQQRPMPEPSITMPRYSSIYKIKCLETQKANLEAQVEEQRKELFRLKEHNRIARSELTRIKDGIKRNDATMIIEGNDMYDWGWITMQEVNSECYKRWGCLFSSKPTIPELQLTMEQLQKEYSHAELFIDYTTMRIDARPLTNPNSPPPPLHPHNNPKNINKEVDDTTPYMGCPNCKSPLSPVFMVHDKLWKESGMEGWPCILCFERAIGRRLRMEDLKPAPLCNHMLPLGWFIGHRQYGCMS